MSKAVSYELPQLSAETARVCETLDRMPGKAMTGDADSSRRAAESAAAIAAIARMGIEVPELVHRAAADVVEAEARARAATEALAAKPFGPDDLLSDDWQRHLAEHCARVAASGTDPSVIANRAAAKVRGRLVRVCASELDGMIDALEAWFIANYDLLAVVDQRTDSFAEGEYRRAVAALFRTAHGAVLDCGPGQRVDSNEAKWWLFWDWDPQQWAALTARTLPAMATTRADNFGGWTVQQPKMLRLARQLGATVRLARSYDQMDSEYRAMRTEAEGLTPPRRRTVAQV